MSFLSRFSALLVVLMCIVGCQTEAKITHERAGDSDIREKILGTWTGDNFGGEHLTLHFDADGTLLIRRAGAPELQKFWRTRSGIIVSQEKNGPPSSSDDWWVVLHINDHELSFCEGPSTGPPLRFTRP